MRWIPPKVPASLATLDPRRRRQRLAIVAVASLAVAVRLHGVWGQSLWEDEVASARVMHAPTLGAALAQIAKTESTPPFWYLLEWSLHRLGMPIVDGRFVSVLAGGALAALVIVLARRVLPFAFALAAGLLVATGSEFVDHGHELRCYELLAALTVLLALCLVELVEKPTRGRAAVVAVVVAAGGLTHFYFALSVAAALAWAVFDRALRGVRALVVSAIAVGCLLPLAWLPVMFSQYHSERFWWIGRFRIRYVVAVPLRLFVYAFMRAPVGPLLSSATLVLVALGGVAVSRRGSTGRLITSLAVVPTCAAAAIWAGGAPIFDLRNLIGTGAFVAIAVLAALAALPRRLATLGAGALVAAVGASLVVFPPAPTPPFASIARALLRDGWNGRQAIAVIGDPNYYLGPLEWYLPGRPRLRVASPARVRCHATFVLGERGRLVARDPASVAPSHHASLLIETYSERGCELTG